MENVSYFYQIRPDKPIMPNKFDQQMFGVRCI